MASRGDWNRGKWREARADRRAVRWAARTAWRRGYFASYVPWLGALYWPYAYTDVFHYTFWPYAYEPDYWAYVYDDFFDGIFFPYGTPQVEYVYAGPYTEAVGLPARQRRIPPGRISQAARDICATPGAGVTAWPFAEIERALDMNEEQRRHFDELRQAADRAAARFKEACPDSMPMTPPGRLLAMTERLDATLAAVRTVQPQLVAFYGSLDDEQKARFNEIGPEVGRGHASVQSKTDAAPESPCGDSQTGLSGITIDRIEAAVQPTDLQRPALRHLDQAIGSAVGILNDACPIATPLTPVGRIEVMEQRLEALIRAARTVQPALEAFYGELSAEQKASFNRIGRELAQAAN